MCALNRKSATFYNLKYYRREIVSRYRDPQLQVCKTKYFCTIEFKIIANPANQILISHLNVLGWRINKHTENGYYDVASTLMVNPWITNVDYGIVFSLSPI